MKDSKTAFFYRYRDIDGFRCVAAVERTANVYRVAFAFCSPKDVNRFSRVIGRSIAAGRLHANKGVVEVHQEEIEPYEGVFNAAIASAIKNNIPNLPQAISGE